MRVGITGHQQLANPTTWDWVEAQMRTLLNGFDPPLLGLTSLARGADQRFAEIALQLGGSFKVILPFAGYEQKFAEGHDRDDFHRLLKLAVSVETLTKYGQGREAYFQAGKQIVHACEVLLAVWDGRPATGKGGTGDVVYYARQCEKPMIWLDTTNRQVVVEEPKT